VRRIQRGKDVSLIESFEQHGLFALATNTPEDFLVVDDEGQPKEVPEGKSSHERTNLDPLEFLPTCSTGALELVDPVSWKTVDTYTLPSPNLTPVLNSANTKQ
jgi:hypothetical protein